MQEKLWQTDLPAASDGNQVRNGLIQERFGFKMRNIRIEIK